MKNNAKAEKIITFLNKNNIKYESFHFRDHSIINFVNKIGWHIQITIPDNSDIFTVTKLVQDDFNSDKITDLIDVL